MNSLDQLIVPFDISEDFYLLLQKSFEHKEYDKIPMLLDNYDKEITEWFEWAKVVEDNNTRYKHISDMRSAFRKYSQFILEKISDAKTHISRVKCKNVKTMFLRNDFIEWLQDNDIYSRHSAESAASRVKSLSDRFISKLIPGETFDFLGELPNLIKKDPEQTILLLDKLVMRVYDSQVIPEEYSINVSSFRYMKRAFSLYASFIKEIICNNYLTSDVIDENRTDSEIGQFDNINKVCFEYDYIKDNFSFRLLTQDRISNSKDLFYPIRLIRRLFCKHDKLVRLGMINGTPDEMKCLFDIVHSCIDKIKVITDKGIFKLKDVRALEINYKINEVVIFMRNGEQAKLLTKTDMGEIEQMKVSNFRDISIDHIIPMSDILDKTADRLPALKRLTALIKQAAKKYNISIVPGNVSRLNNKVLENIEFSEITPIMPQLKKELAIIGSVAELQLMDKTYNIRKK